LLGELEAASNVVYFYRDYTNGETYGVIGSNGGAPDHPHWVYNLVREPMCEVRVGRRKFKVRAHVAEGEEHGRVYGTAVRSSLGSKITRSGAFLAKFEPLCWIRFSRARAGQLRRA
jgi:deazaflavin-dependent oxidoreductase (nitroreductase family)